MSASYSEQLPALGKPRVPLRGLGISSLSLLSAAAISLFWPRAVSEYSGFVWMLALVPVFLLSYYKGWEGAALAAALTMVAFTAAEVVVTPLLGELVDWWLFGIVTTVLAGVTVGAGWLSERLHGQRIDATRMAYEDPLTQLPSRRALDFFLERQVAAARRGLELSVVFFDLDRFKDYNDRHGHGAGDKFLSRVGEILQSDTREMNLVGRYGGEEFLAVLPGEPVEGAREFAERIRSRIEALDPPHGGSCTVSAGVAAFDEHMVEDSDLLTRADQALYRAKSRGGNAVAVYDHEGGNGGDPDASRPR